MLATPGMDRHLAYVGMTRHRDGVEVCAGRDDFKGDEELKAKLSRARPKDSTLDYAQRRGMEAARAQRAEQERPARQERMRQPGQEGKEQGQEAGAGQGDPVARFKQAQRNSSRWPALPTSIPEPRRVPLNCAKR
jgi:ATP-dependent exoDNAse (exonuclease V) beta subunit